MLQPTLTSASTKSGNETPMIEEHMDPLINPDIWCGYLIQKSLKGGPRNFTSLGQAHIRLLQDSQTIPTGSRIPNDYLRKKVVHFDRLKVEHALTSKLKIY